MPAHAQTSADESDTAHLREGASITLEEAALHLSAAKVLLLQVARALETPATAVELADEIDALRRQATDLSGRSETFMRLAAIVDGDVKVSATFPNGDPWGTAARGSDREDFGGPAVIPTTRQLLWLADVAAQAGCDQEGVRLLPGGYEGGSTTYPQAMAGINHRMWESRAAQIRRRRERDAAVAVEVLRITCERCTAGDGEHCRTNTGRISEKVHKSRQSAAEANVDARLGYLGDTPLAVDA
ncbi:zinc finger domain-containing protein [Streptomyces violaceusniger]|uniref:DNA-binding phage zinc finger domain-containing protein n=1 Tax=Streptomyces violaceusniger (strain Tu 4113) TaxID=653045 RepID=G2PI11_STRV4|nr:hypothetical protein [Streptomyces violaceusniger]AEM88962.1 hypothetical protein Strvi_0189 [Streptomyces violaceusniger Tu 4113]